MCSRDERPDRHLPHPAHGLLGGLLAILVLASPGCAQLLGLDDTRGPGDAIPCKSDTECSSTAPICDTLEGVCRGCSAAAECSSKDGATPFCATDGRCGACLLDNDCSGNPAQNICDAEELVCRGCEAHKECASSVCDIATAQCVDPAQVVYTTPNGRSVSNCGTQEEPCGFLPDAITKLTSARPYLRLQGTFNTRLAFTADAIVIGEDAALDLTPVDFDTTPGILISNNARVTIDGLRIANLSVGSGIECMTASLTMRKVSVENNNGDGVRAETCPLIIEESRISSNGGQGIEAFGQNLSVERSLIADNYRGGVTGYDGNLLLRNNLILRNSNLDEYHGAIRLNGAASSSIVSYNTFVGNNVNGNYIGIIACAQNTVLSSNIIWDNHTADYATDDQTLMNCTTVRNNVSDSKLGDAVGNFSGDPGFTDMAGNDYTPKAGSPALDRGQPDLANLLDYAGNSRPVGDGPDIGALERQPLAP